MFLQKVASPKEMIDNLLAGVFCHVFFATLLGQIPSLLLFLHAAPDLLQLWRIFWQGYPQTSSRASATYGNITNWVAGEVCQSYQS